MTERYIDVDGKLWRVTGATDGPFPPGGIEECVRALVAGRGDTLVLQGGARIIINDRTD